MITIWSFLRHLNDRQINFAIALKNGPVHHHPITVGRHDDSSRNDLIVQKRKSAIDSPPDLRACDVRVSHHQRFTVSLSHDRAGSANIGYIDFATTARARPEGI
jgi:hypothetical protein